VLRMVEVTQALAERVSEVARLLEGDDDRDAAMERLTSLGVELVPGAVAAAVTVTGGDQAHTFASSDPRVDELHRLQFSSGAGPVVDTLRYNEARHVRDVAADPRWPAFCQAASAAGFGSCITLPLHTRSEPAGAVTLYAESPDAFGGAAHDLALLLAAQGGTAAHNADIYGASSRMVGNLQVALESRAVIEQAKGVLHAELGVSTDEAFQLLSLASQNTNQKARDIAAKVVSGELSTRQLRARTRQDNK
jgi:GAF domain-containing protein